FDAAFGLQNSGWGEGFEATLTYAFGTEDGPVTEDFVVDIGTIDNYVDATVIDGMIALGADVDRLADWESLECPGFDAEGRCTFAPDDFAEILGGLADAAFVSGGGLRTRMTGQLEYRWVDAWGNSNTRVSPVSLDLPLAY